MKKILQSSLLSLSFFSAYASQLPSYPAHHQQAYLPGADLTHFFASLSDLQNRLCHAEGYLYERSHRNSFSRDEQISLLMGQTNTLLEQIKTFPKSRSSEELENHVRLQAEAIDKYKYLEQKFCEVEAIKTEIIHLREENKTQKRRIRTLEEQLASALLENKQLKKKEEESERSLLTLQEKFEALKNSASSFMTEQSEQEHTLKTQESQIDRLRSDLQKLLLLSQSTDRAPQTKRLEAIEKRIKTFIDFKETINALKQQQSRLTQQLQELDKAKTQAPKVEVLDQDPPAVRIEPPKKGKKTKEPGMIVPAAASAVAVSADQHQIPSTKQQKIVLIPKALPGTDTRKLAESIISSFRDQQKEVDFDSNNADKTEENYQAYKKSMEENFFTPLLEKMSHIHLLRGIELLTQLHIQKKDLPLNSEDINQIDQLIKICIDEKSLLSIFEQEIQKWKKEISILFLKKQLQDMHDLYTELKNDVTLESNIENAQKIALSTIIALILSDDYLSVFDCLEQELSTTHLRLREQITYCVMEALQIKEKTLKEDDVKNRRAFYSLIQEKFEFFHIALLSNDLFHHADPISRFLTLLNKSDDYNFGTKKQRDDYMFHFHGIKFKARMKILLSKALESREKYQDLIKSIEDLFADGSVESFSKMILDKLLVNLESESASAVDQCLIETLFYYFDSFPIKNKNEIVFGPFMKLRQNLSGLNQLLGLYQSAGYSKDMISPHVNKFGTPEVKRQFKDIKV